MALGTGSVGSENAHVSIGGTAVGPDIEGGIEITARPRDIGRSQVSMSTSGTDNEGEGRVLVARPRNIADEEDQGTEMAVHAREINEETRLGPKGLALPKWDSKEHSAAATAAEQSSGAAREARMGAFVASAHSAAWSIADSDLSLPRPSEQPGNTGKALLVSLGSSQLPREAEAIAALGYDLQRHDAAVIGRAPFEDESFDLVVDKCGLDSLARVHSSEGGLAGARLLREVWRVLRPGASFVCISLKPREELLSGPLPGMGKATWLISSCRAVARGDAGVLVSAQRELARALGAIHESLPREGSEKGKLKELIKAAMCPGGGQEERRELEDEATVLCRLFSPELQPVLGRAMSAYLSAKDPVQGGVWVYTCTKPGEEMRSGGAGEEGLGGAMQYLEGLLGDMRQEEGGGLGAADLKNMLMPLVMEGGGAEAAGGGAVGIGAVLGGGDGGGAGGGAGGGFGAGGGQLGALMGGLGVDGREGGFEGLGEAMSHFEEILSTARGEEDSIGGLQDLMQGVMGARGGA